MRRWKSLTLGAANEDQARALAEMITQQAPADASRTQANPFVHGGISQPGTGAAHYLMFFLAG